MDKFDMGRFETEKQEYGKRYIEKLERQKEQLEEDLESFDFRKHNQSALDYVNRELKKAKRTDFLFRLKDGIETVGYGFFVPVFLICMIFGAIVFTWGTATKLPPKEQVQHAIADQPKPVSLPPTLLNNEEEQKKQLDLVKARQQDWLNNLKQSEGYKKNEELAKKLATGKCSYKTTKQGDFYVCEFNAND